MMKIIKNAATLMQGIVVKKKFLIGTNIARIVNVKTFHEKVQ